MDALGLSPIVAVVDEAVHDVFPLDHEEGSVHVPSAHTHARMVMRCVYEKVTSRICDVLAFQVRSRRFEGERPDVYLFGVTSVSSKFKMRALSMLFVLKMCLYGV